jgi:VanZ family protein
MSSGTAPARGIPEVFLAVVDYLKLRRAWLAGGAAFVALVIYLSLTPHPLQVPNVGPFKPGHIIAYTWLMLWFAQLTRVGQRLGIGIALGLMGVALEYLQNYTGHRTFGYTDMRDNAIGVMIGLLLATTPLGLLLKRLARLPAKTP